VEHYLFVRLARALVTDLWPEVDRRLREVESPSRKTSTRAEERLAPVLAAIQAFRCRCCGGWLPIGRRKPGWQIVVMRVKTSYQCEEHRGQSRVPAPALVCDLCFGNENVYPRKWVTLDKHGPLPGRCWCWRAIQGQLGPPGPKMTADLGEIIERARTAAKKLKPGRCVEGAWDWAVAQTYQRYNSFTDLARTFADELDACVIDPHRRYDLYIRAQRAARDEEPYERWEQTSSDVGPGAKYAGLVAKRSYNDDAELPGLVAEPPLGISLPDKTRKEPTRRPRVPPPEPPE
jgi:hypothetical protein